MPTNKKILKDPYDYRLLNPKNFDDRRQVVMALFLRGEPPEAAKRYVDHVGSNNGGWGSGGSPFSTRETRRMWAEEGIARVGYRDDNCLYSYEMPLAFRTSYGDKPFIIINGDGSPTMQTSKHQREFRSVLQDGLTVDPGKSEYVFGEGDKGGSFKTIRPKLVDGSTRLPHAFIPFSILDRPRIRLDDVVVLAVTADFTRLKTVPDRQSGGTRIVKLHFLGETLFRDKRSGHVYVCGLDRNDDPSARMFYLARVPREAQPKTVDEALASLRPEGLPKNAKRQGEWFLVPEPRYKAAKAEILKKVPIVSDVPAEQSNEREVARREGRHVATRMHLNGAVRVSGRLVDDEHDTLPLGDVWHRVVKNKAEEGWRYDNTAGAQVD